MPTPAQQLHNHLQTLKDGWPILSLIAAKKANIMARSTGNGTHSIAPIPVNIDAWQLKQDIDLLTRKPQAYTHTEAWPSQHSSKASCSTKPTSSPTTTPTPSPSKSRSPPSVWIGC